jgi:multiple sugar transport system substrate-binding protein
LECILYPRSNSSKESIVECITDHPKSCGQAIGNGSPTGEIGRRAFLKGALMGAAAGPSVVSALWDGDRVASAHAQGAGDAASRAASAAAALARRKPGVRVRILQPFSTLVNLQPVAEQWATDTGIPVGHIEAPLLEINQRIWQEASAKSGAFDVALALPLGIPDFAATGVLVDLTELAQQYHPDRGAQGCQALYTVGDFYQGRQFGLCTDGDTLVMFYRKDLLDHPDQQQRFADQYGYPLAIPATWNEFDQMVRFFHQPDQGLYGGALVRAVLRASGGGTAGIAEWMIRYHAKGHYLFDDHMHP